MTAVQPATPWTPADTPPPPADPGLADLVDRALRGEADAFGELIDRYDRAALATAYGVLQDAAGAADAVQEACLKAWHKRHTLHDPARFGPWLLHIVRRCALDLGRRTRPYAPLEDESASAAAAGGAPQEDALSPLLRQETDQQVRRALAELDEETRLAVALRYYDGQSSREIAAVLDCSPAAVDMRLKRARDRLRALLGPLMDEPPTT